MCPACRFADGRSTGEKELGESIRRLAPDAVIVESDRHALGGQEVDLIVKLPNHPPLSIEFNGCYWHSEVSGKGRTYHAEKASKLRSLGHDVFMVWEDDWALRRDIVLRGIAHRLGLTPNLRNVLPELPPSLISTVGARSLAPGIVTRSEADTFLESNHIQGTTIGGLRMGLRDREGQLRAVLLGRSRGHGTWEIVRYATAGTVSGGFSKLLKSAETHLDGSLREWVTFADLSLSNGDLYLRTGFVADKTIPPDYSYLRTGTVAQRGHKFNFRLARFRDDPSLTYEADLTEPQLAALNGLVRVWDAGKIRFVKRVM